MDACNRGLTSGDASETCGGVLSNKELLLSA
jgi:hypothetical protein